LCLSICTTVLAQLILDGLPHRALANVIGNVNDVEFGVAKIYANISRTGPLTEVRAIVEDIPGSVGMFAINIRVTEVCV